MTGQLAWKDNQQDRTVNKTGQRTGQLTGQDSWQDRTVKKSEWLDSWQDRWQDRTVDRTVVRTGQRTGHRTRQRTGQRTGQDRTKLPQLRAWMEVIFQVCRSFIPWQRAWEGQTPIGSWIPLDPIFHSSLWSTWLFLKKITLVWVGSGLGSGFGPGPRFKSNSFIFGSRKPNNYGSRQIRIQNTDPNITFPNLTKGRFNQGTCEYRSKHPKDT